MVGGDDGLVGGWELLGVRGGFLMDEFLKDERLKVKFCVFSLGPWTCKDIFGLKKR